MFLLIVLIFPVSGTLTWMYFNKLQIKKSVKRAIIHGVPDHQLNLILITKKERHLLHWKHSKEFEYLGEMYDIVRQESWGDTTHYWCWWDKEETNLNQYINTLAYGFIDKSLERKSKLENLFEFLKSFYFEPQVVFVLNFRVSTDPYQNFPQNELLTSLTVKTYTPPPEIISSRSM
jgi:hypothetical protein